MPVLGWSPFDAKAANPKSSWPCFRCPAIIADHAYKGDAARCQGMPGINVARCPCPKRRRQQAKPDAGCSLPYPPFEPSKHCRLLGLDNVVHNDGRRNVGASTTAASVYTNASIIGVYGYASRIVIDTNPGCGWLNIGI